MNNKLLEFTIICCKTRLTDKDTKILHEHIKTLNVEDIIKFTLKHGVLPIIYQILKNKDNIPKDILSDLKQYYLKIAKKNMLMSAELIQIVKLLEENNIKTISFKGPTLSKLAYKDITLRQYGDLDILISKDDLYKTAYILNKNYNLYGSIELLKNNVWLDISKDITLQHKTKGIILELHWKLFHSTFAKTDSSIDVWMDTTKISLHNNTITTLNINILLSYLCIHGSRHLWERIEWIVDIDRIIRTQEIDWSYVLKASQSFYATNMLLLGISLSYTLLDTPIPDEIKTKISNPKIIKLQNTILDILTNHTSETTSTSNVFKRKKIHASMQDSLYRQLLFWKNVLFAKNYTTILEEKQHKIKSKFDFSRPYKLIHKFIFKL